MEKQLTRGLLLSLLLVALSGCTRTVTEYVTVHNGCDCPPPFEDQDGYKRPALGYNHQQLSVDGKKLAFRLNDGSSTFDYLDLETLTQHHIRLRSILPDSADWLGNDPLGGEYNWCPYSGDKILLRCTGSLVSGGYVDREYLYDLRTNKAILLLKNDYAAFWLRGSREGLDSIMTSSGKIYVPQQDSLYPYPYPDYLAAQSLTANTNVSKTISNGGAIVKYYLNGAYLYLSEEFAAADHISFSPNGKRIAFTAVPNFPVDNPNDPANTFPVVLILDVSSPNDNSYWLNFQCLFCKYSFRGLDAEFITDSTLAVSMHKDLDKVSPLWEITDKGKVVRQLTY